MEIRECKDLQGNEIFELIKYCSCEKCKNRRSKRLHTNEIYIYFKDINKKNEAEKIANDFKCDGVYQNSSLNINKIVTL